MLHTIIQKSDVPQDRLQILVLHKYQHLFPLCVAPVAHLIKDNLPRSPSFISNDHNDPFLPNTGTSLPSSTSTVMSDSMSALSLDCQAMLIDQWLHMGLLAHTVAGDVKFNLETWADPLFEWFDDLHAVQMMPIKASMRKSHVRIALLSKSKECSKKLTEYLGRARDLNVEPTSVCISNWIMDGNQNWESKRDLWYIAQVYALKLKSQDQQALLDIAPPVLHRDRVGYEMLYGVGQPLMSTVSVRVPKRTLQNSSFPCPSWNSGFISSLKRCIRQPCIVSSSLLMHGPVGRHLSILTLLSRYGGLSMMSIVRSIT